MEKYELNTLASVLGVLTALIAPALLVSACGTFILSTSNRLSLTTERVRVLVLQMGRLEAKERTPARAVELERLQLEVQLSFRRVLRQQQALALFYMATVLFVGCSLTLGMEALTAVLPPWLPVALGLAGVAVLLAACSILLLDVQWLVRGMKLEMAAVRRRVAPPARKE
jgi:hypothetical protein